MPGLGGRARGAAGAHVAGAPFLARIDPQAAALGLLDHPASMADQVVTLHSDTLTSHHVTLLRQVHDHVPRGDHLAGGGG